MLASGFANAVAVFVCVWMFNLIGKVIDLGTIDVPFATAGAIAGAAGSLVLGAAATVLFPGSRIGWPVAVGSALGLLVPLVSEVEIVGVFLFYIAWQGGYSIALAASLPAEG